MSNCSEGTDFGGVLPGPFVAMCTNYVI